MFHGVAGVKPSRSEQPVLWPEAKEKERPECRVGPGYGWDWQKSFLESDISGYRKPRQVIEQPKNAISALVFQYSHTPHNDTSINHGPYM